MTKRLVWVGCDGVEWPLSDYGVRGVFVELDGQSGLVGGLDSSPTGLVGSPVRIDDGVPRAMEVSLNLVVASSTSKWGEHGEVPEIAADFARGCSPLEPGVLRLEDDETGESWSLDATCVWPGLPRPNVTRGAQRVTVSFTSIQGRWRHTYTECGDTVTVTNPGDVVTYPRIRWNGAGGQVTLPSGATFTLPAVAGYRTLNLDPASSNEVVDDAGVLDEVVWKKVWGAFTEGVPRGSSKVYVIPATAQVSWDIYRHSPWG